MSYIEFHSGPCLASIIDDVSCKYESSFGRLHIDVPTVPMTTQPLALVINVDRSGSMCDNCADGQSKMQHIQHMLKNLMHVVAKQPGVSIKVCIVAFSHDVGNVFQNLPHWELITDDDGFIHMSSDNVKFVCTAIDYIDPWGVTNLEKSLKYADEKMKTYQNAHPDHRVIHIQLTDGEATSGSTIPAEMQQYVDSSYKHIFVGVGDEHDSYLLNYLAEGSILGEYRFIDQLDKSGWICGEILYDLLYPYYPHHPIHIQMSPGSLIYDWRIDQWVPMLTVPPFSGNRPKDYHVMNLEAEDETSISATVYSGMELLEHVETLPLLMEDDDTHAIIPNDLTLPWLRYRTQVCMYLVTQHELKQNRSEFLNEEASCDSLKQQLSELLHALQHVSEHLDTTDASVDREFLQTLMDDVRISLELLGTQRGYMYTTCRQTSQGNQYAYTPATIVIVSATTDDTVEYNHIHSPTGTNNSNMDMLSIMTQVQGWM